MTDRRENINKITALRKNTTPKAIEMEFDGAFITDDTAAMALPPQMDVPDEII